MKILITGAAGRVGTAVTRHLVNLGLDLRATDQRSHQRMPVPVEPVSLLDPVACYRLMEGVDTLIHIANHANSGSGTPQRVFGENCSMNINVFQAALEMGVRRVIFTSTIQTVIGKTAGWMDPPPPCALAYLPLDGHMPANPGNAYAASKVATELLLESLCRHERLHAVVLRLPHIRRSIEGEPRRRRQPSSESWGQSEAFTFLYEHDLADLVGRILQGSWTGYQCLLPADARTIHALSPREAYEKYLSHIPLRVPLDQLTALTDTSELEQRFGWPQPGKAQALTPAHAEAG